MPNVLLRSVLGLAVLWTVFAGGLPAATAGSCAGGADALFQVSTIDALLAGVYDGAMSLEVLTRHGDFGLGTFDALDGEMVVLDGVVYQVRVDGSVQVMPGAATTPLACVTCFSQDASLHLDTVAGFEDLCRQITAGLPGLNRFYAVRIAGSFSGVTTRSVPRQVKPYPPLAEAAKQQAVFELGAAQGTVVGFYSPAYVQKIGVPGYHLHFLDAAKARGGHLLDISGKNLTVSLDALDGFVLTLPDTPAFQQVNLSGDRSAELTRVEKK